MLIPVKPLNPRAKIPTCGSKYAAGNDLYATIDETVEIKPGETVKIGSGLAMEIPFGYFGAIFARSGIATKRGLRLANSVAVIDADFRGELVIALHNDSSEVQYVEPGERIAQLVLIPYQSMEFKVVDELSETVRGDGGFGSSGTN